MSARSERRGLGRGLSALMADIDSAHGAGEEAGEAPAHRMVPIESVVPNPHQPRRRYAPEALSELADSIRKRDSCSPSSSAASRIPGFFRSLRASGAGARRSRPSCTRFR